MFPLRKTWVLNQEIHWVPIIGTPAVPASCFQVPEQRIVVWLLFYLRLDFKAFCPCVLLFFAIMTPQFQEPSCPSFSRACLYSYTSALLFLSSSDIIFFSYPAPNLSFEIFPLVVLYGIVGIGYLLPNFHWLFFHDACFADILHLNALSCRFHFSQALCHSAALLTRRACRPVLYTCWLSIFFTLVVTIIRRASRQ